jgi:hypothetical protein
MVAALLTSASEARSPNALAAPLKFANQTEVRYLWDDHRLWLADTISATTYIPLADDERRLEITPFVATAYTDTEHDLNKVAGGVTVATSLTPHLTAALTLASVATPHSNLRRELVNKHGGSEGTAEAAARLVFQHPLPFRLLTKPATLALAEAYVYDLRFGEGSRNEVSAGVSIAVTRYVTTGLTWRHVDVVHATDTDELVADIAVTF